MRLTDWPLTERPREKLLRLGVNAVSEAELLAIFLRIGVKGKTAVDLARELLNEFGSLRNLLTLSTTQLLSIKGIGKTKCCMLQAAFELGKRCLEEKLCLSTSFTSSTSVKQYLIAKLSNYKQEVFACLFLNSKHELLRYEELFHGSVSYAPVFPRIIAQKALEYNAAALLIAHNHPSGNVKPSDDDISSTHNLISLLEQLDIRVLDHLIIGQSSCCSLSELGLM